MHDEQTKVVVELVQLCTQTSNGTSKFVEAHSAAIDSDRPAKRAIVRCCSENSMGAPSTAAYCALIAECDEFKSRCEALMLEN